VKEFNITGVCIPKKHYMVDISGKLEKIIGLIEKEEYFTINRARQYGKTTTLSQIYKRLKEKHLVINISFEGIGEKAFSTENEFIESFINLISRRLEQNKVEQEIILKWEDNKSELKKLEDLSKKITQLVEDSKKEVILLIDEVDKSSNNQLFLHFLGMLRNKYLNRAEGLDSTFKSVVLAGVYDVKNLKLKLRPDEEKKYNSPWNIAADFDVDMSFNPGEISTILAEYENDHRTGMDLKMISSEIYEYTNGYPFLVSKLCKLIAEKLNKNWTVNGMEDAATLLLDEKNTLFDDLIKNLENNKALYGLIYDILVLGKKVHFNIDNPVIDMGVMLGILIKKETCISVSNRIFELRIYNYMISKRSTDKGELVTYEYRTRFVVNGKLDMELVLNKFQEVMHDEFREKDARFIEREGRLLFLCFLKPVINGGGFYYVEAETRMDNRMDVVVTYGGQQYIIELKIWYGENYEQNAIEQLAGYLDSKRENKGYLISYNFNKTKEYTREWKKFNDKEIYAIVV
jgi:hypothetical protein